MKKSITSISKLLIPLTGILSCFYAGAQDFTFSQFYEQPLLRNPALAGIFTGDIRVSLAHRDQWASVTTPFRTTSLSIEHKLPVGNKNDLVTVAAQMSQDGAGDIRLKRTHLLPAISYHKSLSDERDSYLTASFMGGPVFSQFDPTQLKFGDQYQNGSINQGTMQTIKSSGYSYWDLSAGLSYNTSFSDKTRFYIAAGLSHITNPVITSTTGSVSGFLSPRMSVNLGIHAPSGERGHVFGFADLFTQNGSKQVLGGLMYGINMREYDNGDPDIFYVGSFMRWGDALIPVVKIEFNHLSIGVSYDVNISRLKVVSNWRGGLEMTIAYRGFTKIRNSMIDRVRCTRF
ncbi:PorP/SprF family type IX secretion system membrane protein [Sediminibacterium goheungense]|uniref:Type IX secretion system PorP/SprF family membrane protein n=1 Tax=Sediminibacterium goheungense TaxID=1086393 RepID=A0A4R6J183_9BACT|nr:PorP/SprF family type IX secretion system membrane protein [Sediminibacterium goheungense]TDO28964.1 type IX secretion system PorP/SprF family membrane protein [Sediminibacterium goheungense]